MGRIRIGNLNLPCPHEHLCPVCDALAQWLTAMSILFPQCGIFDAREDK